MKKARIDFSISMDVYFNERYTAEQIAEMLLDSDRFTIDRVRNDPKCVTILSASTGIEEIAPIGPKPM